MMRKGILVLLTCTLFSIDSYGKITLPAIFSNDMVLQQQSNVSIWGDSDKGAQVTVTPSWSKSGYIAKPNAQGKWEVKIPTPAAGGPHTITISDGEKLTLDNVLLGEVAVSFDYADRGLTTYDKELVNFEIAGGDSVFVPAKARIDQKSATVIVSSDKVDKPIGVRYAFKSWVVGELYNYDGLPASSFESFSR